MKTKIRNFLLVFASLTSVCVFFVFAYAKFNELNKAGEMMMNEKKSPCNGNPVSVIEMGSTQSIENLVEFTTEGGAIYFKARSYNRGGFLNPPNYSTDLFVGSLSALPVQDQQTGSISNAMAKVNFLENEYGKLDLAPGRYWLFTVGGGDIQAVSCKTNGVSNPKSVNLAR